MEPRISISALRENPYYSIYYINLSRLIVNGIIPFVSLTFFNCSIYNRIRRRSNLSEENSPRKQRCGQEHDLARVLLAIVLTFILCHTLRIFLNFYEMIWINDIIACMSAKQDEFPLWCSIVNQFSTLFMVLNSSTNTIIYCCLNKKFRGYMHRRISRLSRRNRDEEQNSTLELQQIGLKNVQFAAERETDLRPVVL